MEIDNNLLDCLFGLLNDVAPLENVLCLFFRLLRGFSYKYIAPKSFFIALILATNIEFLTHTISYRHTGKIRAPEKYEYKIL